MSGRPSSSRWTKRLVSVADFAPRNVPCRLSRCRKPPRPRLTNLARILSGRQNVAPCALAASTAARSSLSVTITRRNHTDNISIASITKNNNFRLSARGCSPSGFDTGTKRDNKQDEKFQGFELKYYQI